ncbi:SH2 domain-containing protein, partial [Aphelenchoides avenae]
MKDFVVDPGDEEGEEEGDDNDEERSKSGSELEEDLEEDDLELVNENIGVQRGGRVVLDSDEEDDDRQRLRNDLFGVDDDEAREERDYGDRRSVGSRSDSEESEKFIVEDDEDRGHRKKRHRHKEFDSQYVDDARDVFGVDDIDDFYDEDEMMMEEDMEDEEQAEGRVPKARVAKQTLLSAIEPSELDKGFLTAFDKRVIFEDRPERFQLRRVPVTEIDEAEVQQETLWIKEYAFEQFPMSQQVGTRFKMIDDSEGTNEHRDVLTRLDEDAPKSITQTLLFIRNQLFEVPFIAFYRKEFIQKSLKITDLWKIYAYDEKYCLLDLRKKKLRELYERMAKYMASCSYEDVERLRKVEETDYMAVNNIRTVEELADVTAHFQLYYGHEVSRMSEWEKVAGQIDFAELGTKFRMSGRSDKYLLCVNNGLGDVAKLFGLNPEEFAFNYAEYPKYELQTHVEESPQEVAERFSEHLLNRDIQTFPSADDVLKGASYLLASQISRQPSVRKKLRKDFRQRLLVSVRCTKKGREEIDRNNPLFGRRYIKDKPVSKLVGDEYLEYIKAQNLGLVEVKLYTDKDDKEMTRDTLLNKVPVDLYQTDDQNDVAQEWNKHRREVMRIVVEDLLGPVLEREAHERLLEEARGHVMRAISQRVMARVAQAPYRREFTYRNEVEEEGEPEEATVRIMGLAYSTDPKEASFAAVIDQDGTMKRDEYQRLPNFFMKANRNNPTHPKTRDMEMLRDFIVKTQPHVIALAGEGLDAIRLQLDLKVLIKNMYDQGELPYSLPVEFVNCDIAKVYMISQAAQDEMPMYPPVLRESICLARCLLDPLVEFCHLCNAEDDILFVKFHPLQDEIPKQDVLWTIHRELIDRVNEVGVDINRCLEFPHTAGMLQFVCGLGPRKAAQLLKILKQNDNLLESRTKLVTYCRMGPK